MDLTLWLQLLGLVVLLGLSAFFSSSETSLFSLDRTQIARMKREKHPRVALIERLLSRPRQLLVTILIGNELVNVSATVLSAVIVVRLVGAELSWINVFVMVPVLLLFGEITPKTLAIGRNVAFASAQSVLIDRFARLIAPLRWVVRRISDFFITLIVGEERTAANIATEDMVRVLASEAVGEGVIDASEAQYIHQIFDFGETMVRDIATPRSRLFMLPAGMPLAQMAIEIDITRHTKVPVHEDGDKDAILGILFARDLLGLNLRETDREAVVKLPAQPALRARNAFRRGAVRHLPRPPIVAGAHRRRIRRRDRPGHDGGSSGVHIRRDRKAARSAAAASAWSTRNLTMGAFAWTRA